MIVYCIISRTDRIVILNVIDFSFVNRRTMSEKRSYFVVFTES